MASHISSLQVALTALIAVGATGCMSLGEFAAMPPVDNSHMSNAILQIAPLGTPRDEAIQRLKTAGIDGDFLHVEKMFLNGEPNKPPQQGTTVDNFYVCQQWRRPNGEIWKFEADLEFDDAGRLAQIHSGEPWLAGTGPGTIMLTRFQPRPDGSFANLGPARDGDIPRLLYGTSNGRVAPGNAAGPHVAVAFTNSPDALGKMTR